MVRAWYLKPWLQQDVSEEKYSEDQKGENLRENLWADNTNKVRRTSESNHPYKRE